MTDNGRRGYKELNKYCYSFELSEGGGAVDTHKNNRFLKGEAEKNCKNMLNKADPQGLKYKGFFTHTPKDEKGKLWERGKHCYYCMNDPMLESGAQTNYNETLINMETIIPEALQNEYLQRGELVFDDLSDDIKNLYEDRDACRSFWQNDCATRTNNMIKPSDCSWDHLDTEKQKSGCIQYDDDSDDDSEMVECTIKDNESTCTA